MKHRGEGSIRVRVTAISFQSKVTMVNLYLIQDELCSHNANEISHPLHCASMLLSAFKLLFLKLLFLLLTEVIMVSNNKSTLLSLLVFLFVHPLLLLFALK